jgi:hypothetical protein
VAWGVVYYRSEDGHVPADAFLDRCPVELRILAVLEAVRAAPPPQFSGGGMWEAMHGRMAGYHEIRVKGPGRMHYRLFCMLENGSAEQLRERGFDAPQIVVLTGMAKANGQRFSEADYRAVRAIGDDYRRCFPRRIAED